MRKKLMPPAALLMLSLLTACGTNTNVTDSGCRSFRPIAMSKKDTDDTKRQVVGHNRAFDAICPAKVS